MNLLIVDDEKLEVETIKKLIENIGINFEHIYKAYSVEEAIQFLKESVISILICDIEMPGESGHDLTEWIRNRNMDIEVIFVTGHAEFDYATMALRLGVSDYLLKPVKKEALERALYKTLYDSGEVGEPNVAHSEMIVEQVKIYIKEHCDEMLSREQLAEKFFVHPNHLSRIFKKYTSTSLRDYITMVRMEKAKKLLLYSNESITDIAVQIGYSNTTNFIKLFKREIKMTPKQYRKVMEAKDTPIDNCYK